jgi:hypothetical protein
VANTASQQSTLKFIYEKHKTFVAVIALATSFGSFAAQTVINRLLQRKVLTKIAKAERAGASDYKITSLHPRVTALNC